MDTGKFIVAYILLSMSIGCKPKEYLEARAYIYETKVYRWRSNLLPEVYYEFKVDSMVVRNRWRHPPFYNGHFSNPKVGDSLRIEFVIDKPRKVKVKSIIHAHGDHADNVYIYNAVHYPGKRTILGGEPLALRGGTKRIATGIVSDVHHLRSLHDTQQRYVVLAFTYIVKGAVLDGFRELPESYRDLYPNLNKGDRFTVEYLGADPARCVIHLDKPIMKPH